MSPPHFGLKLNNLERTPEMATVCVVCRLPDPDENHVAIEAIRAVWPDANIVGQWLTANELFPESGQCKDCGDPLNQPSLMQRCRVRHQVLPA
jgi:hypothetical protein